MVTFRRLANDVLAEPFRPFRIRMTSGESFEMRHPEMIQIGRTKAIVLRWMNDDDTDVPERERESSILLIESIELLESSASPQG